MGIEAWTLAIAAVTALTCALCGVLLLVNREALVSEGLSHAVLPGIILAFVVLHDRSSPLLIVSAAGAGLVMVLLMQAIKRTGLVKDDAPLGIVFPALFSIGVILASRELGNTHFHAHCIIEGNLALAPLERWRLGGSDVGPKPFYAMAGVLAVVAVFLALFFKELKLMVFDAGLARSLGFRPALLHVVWLGLVSMTTVSAFETAGSILVVALMITPPAAAYLLTDDLKRMLAIAAVLGVGSAIGGFYLALALDIAPMGPMASVAGAVFLVVLLGAPQRGLIAGLRRRRRQTRDLQEHLLLLRLQRLGTADLPALAAGLPWERGVLRAALGRTQAAGDVTVEGGAFVLSPSGRSRAATLLA